MKIHSGIDEEPNSKHSFGQEFRLETTGRMALGKTLWLCTRLTVVTLFVDYMLA
jgi:hypothetical protein